MYDAVIIGGGAVGCAVARWLSRYRLRICLLERSEDVCTGTSKANSAICHAGFDAPVGSAKARFNVEGSRMMEALSRQLDFPYRRCGALVLCFNETDIPRLEDLKARGECNGVEGLTILDRDALRRQEPRVSPQAAAALYVPTSAIICPFGMTIALAENAAANGCEFRFDTEVQRIRRQDDHFLLETAQGVLESRAVICAAGVHGDTFHNQLCESQLHIVPRRGEYCLLDRRDGGLARHTIFQLPSAMGKGVLVTPTVHGNLLVGPTAEDQEDKGCTATTAAGLRRVAETASRSVRTSPCGMSSPASPGFAPIWWVVTTTSSWARAPTASSRPWASSPPACPPPPPSAGIWPDWPRRSWARRRRMTSSRSAAISPVPVRWTLPPDRR